jgi:hypothetical protein
MSENDDSLKEPTPSGQLRRVLLDVSPPKSAHLMSWTRAGTQVLLEIGYFDLYSLHQQRQPAFDGERVLEWFITDRFIVDIDTATRMAQSLSDLATHLSELGEEKESTDERSEPAQ